MQFITKILISLTNYSCRNSCDNCIWRNVFSNNSTRCYYCSFPNMYTMQDNRIWPYPDSVFYYNRFLCLSIASEPRVSMVMLFSPYRNSCGKIYIFPNWYAISSIQYSMIAYNWSVINLYIVRRANFTIREIYRILQDRLHIPW